MDNPIPASHAPGDTAPARHPSARTLVAVWALLLGATALLAGLAHLGQGPAVWGLLTLTPLKAGLVFMYFMHLKYEGLLIKGVVLAALGFLLISFGLLFADIAFR